MIDYIAKNTIAFIVNLELENDFNTFIAVDLSTYKYNNYIDYLVYIVDDGTVVLTANRKLIGKRILLTQEELKKQCHLDLKIIILPVSNKFASDFSKIESKLNPINKDIDKFINKSILYLHLSLPFFGMLFLSSAVTTYSALFHIPIDMIDISSQVNILYKIILSLIIGISNLITQTKNFIFIAILLISFIIFVTPIPDIIYKRQLPRYIFLAPKFLLSLYPIIKQHLPMILKTFYFGVMLAIIISFGNLVKELEYPDKKVLNCTSSKYNHIQNLLHGGQINLFLNSLLEFDNLSAFPQYLKLESGQFVIIKAAKDDLVYYYTFNDFFANVSSQDINKTINSIVCRHYDQNMTLYTKITSVAKNMSFQYDLTLGLPEPKSNLAPTSILIKSVNAKDDYYKKADEYLQAVCHFK